MPGEGQVEAHRALLERGESHVPRGEPDSRADRGDVVEVVVEPLQLEQERAGASQLPRRREAEDALAGQRVGDRVGDRAGAAGSLGKGQAVGQLLPLGGALQPAVLVEEAQVEEEDPLADDVEAEVARTRSRRRGSARRRPRTPPRPRRGRSSSPCRGGGRRAGAAARGRGIAGRRGRGPRARPIPPRAGSRRSRAARRPRGRSTGRGCWRRARTARASAAASPALRRRLRRSARRRRALRDRRRASPKPGQPPARRSGAACRRAHAPLLIRASTMSEPGRA